MDPVVPGSVAVPPSVDVASVDVAPVDVVAVPVDVVAVAVAVAVVVVGDPAALEASAHSSSISVHVAVFRQQSPLRNSHSRSRSPSRETQPVYDLPYE